MTFEGSARGGADARRATPRIRMSRRLRRSRLGRWARDRHRHTVTRREVRRHPGRFDEVATCCLFIGHVKSGGSLLGAMLDAHPHTAFADEMDVVAQVEAGLDRDQVFALLLRGAHREAQNGRVTARRLDPYSLAVPGLWQGTHDRLRVVGDSRAGPTTRALGNDVGRLARLQAVMGRTRLAFVHVVRDPFEPIGAMVRRSGRPIEDAIADHRRQCERLATLRARIAPSDLAVVRYEDLVADPRRRLREILSFLELETLPDHLDACGSLVARGPVRERHLITWEPRHLAEVNRTIGSYDFLAGYELAPER